MAELIKALNLEFGYNEQEMLLKNFDLKVESGDFLGLIGPNGAGKTTILRILSGFLEPLSGKVLLKGKNIANVSSRKRAGIMAVVPQLVMTPMPYSVQQIVEMGRTASLPLFSPLNRHDKEIVQQSIDDMDLGNLSSHRFNKLSGGERQRTIIAAALAQQPELLLLDEPTAALDLGHKIKLMRILEKQQERGIAIMVISHDIELMARHCKCLSLLYKGKILASGTAAEIIQPHLIKQAYDCDVEVKYAQNNIPQIIPLS